MTARRAPLDCTFVTRPQSRVGGDYLHRARWPAEALGEHMPSAVVQLAHPQCLEAMAKTRVLVVGMVIEPDMLRVMDLRRQRGLATVFEVSDDFTAFPPSLPLHRFYAQPHVQQLARQLCERADAVEFSSPYLAEKFGHLNEQHVVFPNEIRQLPPLPSSRPPGPLQVGWAGSDGHLRDAGELSECLVPCFRPGGRRRFPDHQLQLQVMCSRVVARAFSDAGLEFVRRDTGDMNAYFQFLEGLDIGLAYVADDPFAQGRSDGKFIEYASRGVVALCSRRGTYAHTVRDGETGFLYSSQQQLAELLRCLHQSRPTLQRVRHRAHAHLAQERTHRCAARKRAAFYREVAARAAEQGAANDWGISPLQPPEGFSQPQHVVEERFLVAALLQNEGRGADALAEFFALTKAEPEHYRAWEALAGLYKQLGLTESLALLERTAHDTKQRAFEACFP